MPTTLTEVQKQDHTTNLSRKNANEPCFEETSPGMDSPIKNPADTIDSTAKESSDLMEPSSKDVADTIDCNTKKTDDKTNSIIKKEEANHEKVDEKNNDQHSITQQQKIESKKRNPTYPDGVLKTTARINHGVNNSKYDPSVLPTTNDPQKIREQVEFYFGDTNLATDKYMLELTGRTLNIPVPIKKICVFGRMRRFSSYSEIVSALKDSQYLKVSGEEGEELVERKVPYDPEFSRDAESRSIYAKGFGDENPSTQFEIETFFASYGRTNAVRLRRTHEKLFKGSVFVEFADEETAQKFLNLPRKPLWKDVYELKIMPKKEYIELKKAEAESWRKNPTGKKQLVKDKSRGKDSKKSRGISGGRGNLRGRNGRRTDNRDSDDWRKRRDDDRASGFKNDRKQHHGKKKERDHQSGNNEDKEDQTNNISNDENLDGSKGKEVKIKSEPKDEEAKIKSEPRNEEYRTFDEQEKGDRNHPDSTIENSAEPEANSSKDVEQQIKSPPSKKRAHEEDDALEQNPGKKTDSKKHVSVKA